jgi:2'-5' RNA ligase
MTETLRTFVAIELSRQLAVRLGRLQDQLRGHRIDIRWVRPENIHLTLKFLGATPAADLAVLNQALAGAVRGHAPFNLFLKGIGAFPGFDRPRVVWVGLDGQTAALQALQRAVADALMAIGFPSETRPFQGHLTLGRAKGRVDQARLRHAAETLQSFESGPFRVDRIVLFRSDLKPGGAVYTRLRSVDLGPIVVPDSPGAH